MRMFSWPTVVRLFLTVVLAAVLIGCERITQENYNKIETDMTLAQVKEILGNPTEINSMGFGPLTGANAVWRSKNIEISVQFLNDKVKMKNFVQ